MAWTNDQLRAIKTRGGKVLVSAAAGSGKTAVLSERVLDFILSGGNVDKLLVVTFTDAAAIEMKTRIKLKIEEKVLEEKENKHLLKQLTLIDNAKIATMDSFYSELVKQNFDKLDIMPNFSILSKPEEDILKNKVIDDLLEESFDDDLINLLHVFNSSSNDLIKDKIIKISEFLNSIPFCKNYINDILDNYSNNYYKDLFIEEIKENISSYKKLYEEIKEELFNASSDFDKLTDNILEEVNIINKVLNSSSLDDLAVIIRTTSFSKQARITGHSDDYVFKKYKTIRKNLKDLIQKKLLYISNFTDSEYQRQISIMKKVLETLFNIVLKFKDNLLLEKKKINKFSFSDIPLFVIELLIKDGKKTKLAEDISLMFDEILIDEYQDTNKLQSIIFNSISKDESNLFVVGDIKQSIYKFRSACPDIFNDDKNNSFKDKFPMLITLSKNFRSRNLVLDFCNYIFINTMSNYLGEVDYNEDEMLYTGASFPDNLDAISEVSIINYEQELDEEDELSKTEKEAIYVADRIKYLLDSKYQVYDKKGFYRDIKPSDIAILSRSLSNSDVYRLALLNRGIGVYCNKDLTFFDNYDIKLVISILKLIDNYLDDISLMSVLKSDLFNITDEEIAIERINNRYSNLYDCIKNSDNKKFIEFINIFNEFKNYSINNSISDTINYIYKKLDVINKIGVDKNKLKNLTLMIKNAKDYESNSYKTLHDFVSYIDELLLDKSSFTGSNPLSDGDNVLMTTIHRSKGLEYPIVFVCNTGKKFNDQDFKEDYLLDSKYGIAFDVFDYDKKYKYETIPMNVLKTKMKLLNLSEELRVLYVALTRAREKLIITGYVNNLSKILEEASYLMGEYESIDNTYLKECNTYIKWILASILRHSSSKELREYANIDCKVFNHDSKFKVNIIEAKDIKDEILEEKEDITFEYKDNKIINYDISLSNIPSKLSVSEIKKGNKKFVRKPYFLSSNVKSTNLGTLYHKVFELLPVKKYNINTLREELNNLNLKKEELELINIEKILSYLTSSLYDIILSSDKVYKEKEITFYAPSTYYDENIKNGNILVDGIIDLLLEKDNNYTIIDYKTDKVNTLEELVDLYKVQLDLYEIAIKNKYNVVYVDKYIYSLHLNKYIKI